MQSYKSYSTPYRLFFSYALFVHRFNHVYKRSQYMDGLAEGGGGSETPIKREQWTGVWNHPLASVR